jgi:chaperonin cofactor prefoldin
MLGSILGAGASLVGSALDYKGQSDANAANVALSQAQMDFQERMSNTAYRRAMRDMRKAGLNPILAYQRGGASAPFGAAIPQVNPWAGATQGFGQAASSAANFLQLEANLSKVEAEIENIEQDTENKKAIEYLTRVDSALRAAQVDTERLRPDQLRSEIERLGWSSSHLMKQIDSLQQQMNIRDFQELDAANLESLLANHPWLRIISNLSTITGLKGTEIK